MIESTARIRHISKIHAAKMATATFLIRFVEKDRISRRDASMFAMGTRG